MAKKIKRVPMGTMIGGAHIGGLTRKDLITMANNWDYNADNAMIEWEARVNRQMASEYRMWAERLKTKKKIRRLKKI